MKPHATHLAFAFACASTACTPPPSAPTTATNAVTTVTLPATTTAPPSDATGAPVYYRVVYAAPWLTGGSTSPTGTDTGPPRPKPEVAPLSPTGPVPPGQFECTDHHPRGDGTQRTVLCAIGAHYCYGSSGGAAISHGALCKPLPSPGATCTDLTTIEHAGCSGTPETGMTVAMVYP